MELRASEEERALIVPGFAFWAAEHLEMRERETGFLIECFERLHHSNKVPRDACVSRTPTSDRDKEANTWCELCTGSWSTGLFNLTTEQESMVVGPRS